MGKTELLGRYRLGEQIGEGGFAQVFSAFVEGPDGFTKRVALKRVRSELAIHPDVGEVLKREASLAQRLQHGNLVQVIDLGVEGGSPYVVMEHVDGLALSELLSVLEGGFRLDLAESLFVVEEIGHALDYVHRARGEQGQPLELVHRDVKPSNILVSREGVVKLTDFGIARALLRPGDHTLPGVIKGTIGYMSPEQASGQPVDARSDQFSLGVVLYELLGGENPARRADTPTAALFALSEGFEPLKEGGAIDREMVAIVARALAPEPEDRFPSVADFVRAIERWRVGRGYSKAAASLASKVRRALGEPETVQTRALDGALLEMLPHDVTVRHGSEPASLEYTDSPPRRPVTAWAFAVLGALIVVAGAALLFAFAGGGDNGNREDESGKTASNQVADPAAEERTDEKRPAAATVADAGVAPPDADGGGTDTGGTDAGAAVATGTDGGTGQALADSGSEQTADVARRKQEGEERKRDRHATLTINCLPVCTVKVGKTNLGQTPITGQRVRVRGRTWVKLSRDGVVFKSRRIKAGDHLNMGVVR